MIFRISRGIRANRRISPMAPSRWVGAVFSDFSRSAIIRRKRPLLGAGVRNMRLRGPAFGRLGSSGNLEAPPIDSHNLTQGPVSMSLRRFPRFQGPLRNSDITTPNRGGCVKYETHRARGRSPRILRKSRDPAANLMISHMAPSRRVGAVCEDFSRSSRILRKRALLGAGGCNMRLPGSAVNRIGSSGESRRSPSNLRICFSAPSRWACAVWSDFSRSSIIRRKRPYLGRGREIRDP